MKKIIGIFIISVMYASTVFGMSNECQIKMEKYDVDMKISPDNVKCLLSAMSEEVNKQSPITVDNITVLTNTVSINNTLIYRYTVDGKLDNISEIKNSMKTKNKNILCDLDIMRDILKNNGNIKYEYYNKNMKKYFDFTISSCPK